MYFDQLAELGVNALVLVAWLSAPGVLAALVVGLLVSLFQAVTQLQEQTIAMVPKILAVYVACGLFGLWMLREIVRFAEYALSLVLPV